MSDNVNGSSQTEVPQSQPVNDQPQRTGLSEISSLARQRAAQQASAPAPKAPDAGTATPGSQQVPPAQEAQRSEYIPRSRFDEVNARKQQLEAEVEMLRHWNRQQGAPGGMQPVTQAPQAQATMGGMVGGQPQPQLTPAQAKTLVEALADKSEQEKWRKRIADAPVQGLAEFVVHAIQTEGARLLEQALGPLRQQLNPLQQTFLSQQIGQYSAQRNSDPAWNTIEGTFTQMAIQAAQAGHQLTPHTLGLIEVAARQHHGVPVFGAYQAPQPPFTERPGTGAQALGQPQLPPLTEAQRRMAAAFGMSEQDYAAKYVAIKGGAR